MGMYHMYICVREGCLHRSTLTNTEETGCGFHCFHCFWLFSLNADSCWLSGMSVVLMRLTEFDFAACTLKFES